MTTRPLEHLVFLSVIASGNPDEEEEGKIVLLAWQIFCLSKNMVLEADMTYICPTSGMPRKGTLPTGISEESLRGAPNLETALKQFHSSLTKLAGSTFSIMTLGARPLRNYLHPESHKYALTLQRYLNHYLDLNKEFAKSFPSAESPASLDLMAELLSIDPSAESNLGLRQVITMCSVAQKLLERGHMFQCAEVIRGKPEFSASPNPSQVKENCIIRLRGLPFQATIDDVAGFLTGLNIIPGGIVFGINAVGRRTGEATVALESPEQAELGMKRHKHYLNQRYVEVYEASVEDFLRLANVGGGASSGGTAKDKVYVARMQGLPYRASESEIVDFFGDPAPVKGGEDGVHIVRYPDGRASGDAFAIFEEETHLEEALKLNRSNLGTRYVELFKSSVKEFQLVLGRSGSVQKQRHFAELLGLSADSSSEMQALRGRDKKFVKLRGLPWSCKPEDIIEFFGSLRDDIAPHGVHMVLNAVNRPTGECYVQLKSVDGASKAAMELHKQYIKDRYIEVFQCSGDEVAQAILEHGTGGGSSGGGGGGGGRGYSSYRGGGRGGGDGGGGGGGRRRRSSGACVKCRGLPYSTKEEELVEFFAEYDVGFSDVEIVFNNDGRPAGIAYVTFSSRSVAQSAVKEKNGQHIGTRYVDLSIS